LKYRPVSILISGQNEPGEVLERLREMGLNYPVIAKPDRGFRGYLVKKIDSPEELLRYLDQVKTDILIQEFIPFHKELGVFYHRFPGEAHGQVTSVTIKEFLKIKGDGEHTLKELISNDSRAYLYLKTFSLIHKDRMHQVPKKDEQIVLSLIGNHSKGTRFVNGNHLIDDKLSQLMDEICRPMKGFYYGRLDIKYRDLETLLSGQSFKVLEVNGIISEPTHIYDSSHQDASYFKALRAINEHWKIMSKIAHINHHQHNATYPGVWEYINNLRWLRRHSNMLKALNSKEF
jgi:hypothetical protein